jgi:phosphoglycolate phosphatase
MARIIASLSLQFPEQPGTEWGHERFPYAIVGFDLDGTCATRLMTWAPRSTARLPCRTDHVRPARGAPVHRRRLGPDAAQRADRHGRLRRGGLPALQDRLFDYYSEAIAVHSRLFPGGEAMLDDLAARG